MSELEKVEREYRALATKLIYGSFSAETNPQEKRRLDELSDLRVTLSAPDFSHLVSAAY